MKNKTKNFSYFESFMSLYSPESKSVILSSKHGISKTIPEIEVMKFQFETLPKGV